MLQRAICSRCSARGDLCSKRWIWEQYDYHGAHQHAGRSRRDAAIVRIKETGTSIAMSLDGNGRYCYALPREGAKLMVAECCRNLSTVGRAPGGRHQQSELRQSRAARDHGATGGSDRRHRRSLRRSSKRRSPAATSACTTKPWAKRIYPTPVMGIVGLMKTARADDRFPSQHAGREVILLGGLRQLR